MNIERKIKEVKKYYHLRENEFYHTINHIRSMLVIFYEHEQEIDKYYPNLDKNILIDAILYHDAGYEPGNPKNEENAAIIYMNKQDSSITMEHKLRVIVAILSTIPFSFNSHATDYDDILHDLDWFDFATNKFFSNETLIRNEYKKVSDEEFFKARLDFYEKCIEVYGKKLYRSKAFEKYNEIAYKNITERIQELKNIIK